MRDVFVYHRQEVVMMFSSVQKYPAEKIRDRAYEEIAEWDSEKVAKEIVEQHTHVPAEVEVERTNDELVNATVSSEVFSLEQFLSLCSIEQIHQGYHPSGVSFALAGIEG